jgi:hypothetical protein
MSLIEKAMQGAMGAGRAARVERDPAAAAWAGLGQGDADAAANGMQAASPPLAPLSTLLVLGAGGTLGSAVLAEALVAGRFQRVFALVAEPLAGVVRSAVRGFVPLPAQLLKQGLPMPIESAVLVFERGRHSNGRDDAFVAPQPEQLWKFATRLRKAGVKRLVVVVPHAPALLPQALGRGLASLDEGSVAALGFEHLVFVRAAQDRQAERAPTALGRFAAWWLSQMRWMVPQQQQPVRAAMLARCVVQTLRLLPQSRAGTRVLAPERLWQAAQAAGGEKKGNEATSALDAAITEWLGPTVVMRGGGAGHDSLPR